MAETKIVHLPRPLPHQVPILLSSARQKVVVAGRRWGKSVLGLLACILGHGPDRSYKGALEGAQIRWIAPTYPLSTPMWESLKNATWECAAHKDELHRTITFYGGGSVAVRSADDPDSLRGVGSDGVVMDEAAFMAQGAWENGIRPTLADRQGWIVFISSPNGHGWFYELFRNAQTTDGWAAWQRPTSDNPRIPPEEIEAARRDTGSWRFRQEWLAEFVAPGAGMFRREWFGVPKDGIAEAGVLIRVRFWDLAASVSDTAKYTAGVRLAVTNEGKTWIEHVVRGRWTAGARDDVIAQTAGADPPGTIVRIEQEPGSGGLAQIDTLKRRLYGYHVTEDRVSGDKGTRAGPFASHAEAGHIILSRGQWNGAYLDELEAFQVPVKPDHIVDQVDASSGAYNFIAAWLEGQHIQFTPERAGGWETVAAEDDPPENRDPLAGWRPRSPF